MISESKGQDTYTNHTNTYPYLMHHASPPIAISNLFPSQFLRIPFPLLHLVANHNQGTTYHLLVGGSSPLQGEILVVPDGEKLKWRYRLIDNTACCRKKWMLTRGVKIDNCFPVEYLYHGSDFIYACL